MYAGMLARCHRSSRVGICFGWVGYLVGSICRITTNKQASEQTPLHRNLVAKRIASIILLFTHTAMGLRMYVLHPRTRLYSRSRGHQPPR